MEDEGGTGASGHKDGDKERALSACPHSRNKPLVKRGGTTIGDHLTGTNTAEPCGAANLLTS